MKKKAHYVKRCHFFQHYLVYGRFFSLTIIMLHLKMSNMGNEMLFFREKHTGKWVGLLDTGGKSIQAFIMQVKEISVHRF